MKSRLAFLSRFPLVLFTLMALAIGSPVPGDTHDLKTGAFQVQQELVLPASPEAVYDAMTGDISGWWDHHFSPHPKRIFIEPKPGGGFWEIFDDAGNGALHATVIVADRGKTLRFVGPLGFSGQAVTIVTSFEFLPDPGGTKLRLTCNFAGQYEEGTGKIVDQVWRHFLFERLKPYIESGAYKTKTKQ